VAELEDDGVTRTYRVQAAASPSAPRILKTFPLEPYADAESRERFRREVVIQMSVHHPNVWEVVDYGFWNTTIPYLVMEDFGGSTLASELQRRGPFPHARWYVVMTELLLGLEAIHKAGVVHRLLSPERILVTTAGHCKIFDFGLSTRQGMSRLTPSGVSMGSPEYAAPEQLFNAHHVDGRADIFTVGVIGYELLTGHLPIETKGVPERVHRLASGDFDPLIRWRHDLPEGVGTWLAIMLGNPREKRFADASSALALLPEPEAS
jgi:serine/threonine-protein kinase